MKSRVVAVGVLLFVVLLIVWNAVLFGPAGKSESNAKQRDTVALAATPQLASQLKALQEIARKGPEFQAKIDRLNHAVPVKPDLEGFMRVADTIQKKSGVDWVHIESAAPTSGTGASEIRMSIIVSGGYYQVLDYLRQIETTTRIVVVDGISVATSANESAATGKGTTTPTAAPNGAPNLTVTLNARMFTQSSAASSQTNGLGGQRNASTSTAPQDKTPATAGGNN